MKKLWAYLCMLLGIGYVQTSFAAGVNLAWQAPTMLADGRPIPVGETITYNMYRGNRSDGSDLTLLNPSVPIMGLTYNDSTALVNHVYYYVVRTVRVLNNLESRKSNVAVIDLVPTMQPANLAGNPNP